MAQVRPIIDNGFLGEQFWATGIHPSGDFIVIADRSVLHAHDRKNNMLFQTYQAPCIVNTIDFSPDGKLMFVNTTGEIGQECNRAVVYDFYTGRVLYNQQGTIVKTLGKGPFFYIRKFDAGMETYFLELHRYDRPGPVSEKRYYPPVDTVSTVIIGHSGHLEITGKCTAADLASGKFPVDSLPKTWRSEKSRKDLKFEYITEKAEDSLVVGSIPDLSLIIDTVGLVSDNQTISVYGLHSGHLIADIDDAQFFGYSYVESLNKIYFESATDPAGLITLDLSSLEVKRNKIDAYTAHYRVMENDSSFYEVQVREEKVYIRQCTGLVHPVSTYRTIAHSYAEYELFNQGRYYGLVLPSRKIIIHNKNKIIDLNDMTMVSVSTFPDTTLLHPAIVSMLPSDPYTLKINGWTWDMKSAMQFHSPPVVDPRNLRAADSLFYAHSIPVANPSATIVRYLAASLPLYNYKKISYPFGKKPSYFSDVSNPVSGPYQNIMYSQASIFTDNARSRYYLLDAVYSDSVKIEAPFIGEKALKKEETKFREFVQRHYTAERLLDLNVFPEYTLFPFHHDESFPLPIAWQYNKQNHIAWTYDPLFYNYGEKVTRDRSKAVLYTVRNLFKLSFQPHDPLETSEYTVNIINRESLPMLDYAGIIPDNDIYYSDITFPLTDQRLISLNYAYGVFSLRKADGTTIVQSSLYRNGEFIHITPEGYYFASKSKLQRISLRKDNAVYPIEQFDLKYNRPDIVLQRLGCTDQPTIDGYHKAYLKRLKKMGFTEEMLTDDFHLPELHIANRYELPAETDSSFIELDLETEDLLFPLDRINVLINGVPVYGSAGISLREKNLNRFRKKIRVDLCTGINNIAVSVLNQAGAESYRSSIQVSSKTPEVKPNLYLISIGDSKYSDERYNLAYARKDAQDISSTITQNTPGIYGKVFACTLTDEQVSRGNILKLKKELKKAGRNDVVMITVAGHGVLDRDFNYYLATYDMDFNDPSKKGLPYEELESLLDGIAPLRKTILIDACHSGEVDKDEVEALASAGPAASGDIKFRAAGAGIRKKNLGLKTSSELMAELFTDLRKGTGATVISSASGVEYAMESGQWQNGLFTYCLLHGLQDRQADLNHDGEIWLSELQQYLSAEVTHLSNGQQQPTSRIENMSMDFRLW